MTHPEISIIIPIYNAETKLRSCLNSACKQTLQNIEIICIDDGSTDSSPALVKEFSDKDHRFKFLQHATNEGAWAARNSGLEIASGEFVCCLDADDFIPPNALQALFIQAQKNKSDMVKGSLLWFKVENDENPKLIGPSTGGNVITTNIFQSKFLQRMPSGNCCNLYRKQMLDTHKMRFRNLTFGEDHVFQATALVHSNRVTLIDDVVYHYNNFNNESVTKKTPSMRNLIDDIRFHCIVAETLTNVGLRDAGMYFIKNWSYPIKEYWSHIPHSLSLEECTEVFAAFRESIAPYKEAPWDESMPYHHRFLLALVLAGLDQEAIKYLASIEFVQGLVKRPVTNR